jgi:hypothetical protein
MIITTNYILECSKYISNKSIKLLSCSSQKINKIIKKYRYKLKYSLYDCTKNSLFALYLYNQINNYYYHKYYKITKNIFYKISCARSSTYQILIATDNRIVLSKRYADSSTTYYNILDTQIKNIRDIENPKYLKTLLPCIKWLKITTLEFNYCLKIITIPQFIKKLTNLSILNIQHCPKITEIPKFIKKLINLTTLDIYDSKLRGIPKFIKKLTNLTTLNIEHSKLKEIPKFIKKLKLKELDLSGNNLSNIKEMMPKLKHIQNCKLHNRKKSKYKR